MFVVLVVSPLMNLMRIPSSRPTLRATHLWLLEEDGPLWVDAAGQQARRHVQDARTEQNRVLRLRDGVQVHDAVQHRGELLLQGHPVLQGTQVVAQMGHPGWLDSREDPPTSSSILGWWKKKKSSKAKFTCR